MRFKIAFRNILRHRLRSILSIGMITGAVCSIILFHGFSNYTIEALKFIAAENQYGNMQIASKKYWSPGKEEHSERMFSLQELAVLNNKNYGITQVSGRLSFYGLVSNGDISTGAKMIGIDTIAEVKFKKAIRILSGNFFTDNQLPEAMVGRLLAKQMNVKEGDNITVVTNTVDGIMNAMDLTVSGIYSAGIDEVDLQVIYLPITIAQNILNTTNVDIAVLKFDKLPLAEKNLLPINNDLKNTSSKLFAKSWRELATLFRQASKFSSVQNTVIEGILLSLMFLGILNTVSMTVVERTGEIGILRSLGETRREVVKQFMLESLIIAFVGIFLGIIAAKIIIEILSIAHIMIEMPGASTPFKITINFVYTSVLYASSLALCTTMIATLIPALKTTKIDIVEALRKNI